MRRKYTYSKKVLYIFSINAKDLRRCEGFAKEIYTPGSQRCLKRREGEAKNQNFQEKSTSIKVILVKIGM